MNLRQLVGRTTEALRGVLLVQMPDSTHFDSWMAEPIDGESVAHYVGDMVRAHAHALEGLGSRTEKVDITIETGHLTVIVKPLTARISGAFLFDRLTPLGMARLELKRLLTHLVPNLPTEKVEHRPRGVRLMEFLRRYAPDPHAVFLRISLRTGIELSSLESPEALSVEEVSALEEATRYILGLETLSI
jgi:hypothetical protein